MQLPSGPVLLARHLQDEVIRHYAGLMTKEKTSSFRQSVPTIRMRLCTAKKRCLMFPSHRNLGVTCGIRTNVLAGVPTGMPTCSPDLSPKGET